MNILRDGGEPQDIVGYMTSPEPGSDHDQLGIAVAVWSQRLFQTRDGTEHSCGKRFLVANCLISRSKSMRNAGNSNDRCPADFFRTMEDASGVDLDWFWRGWFYSTDHVDLPLPVCDK